MRLVLIACHWWIVVLWVVFVVYWAIAAIRMKSAVGRTVNREGMAVRLILFAALVLFYALARRAPGWRALQMAELHSVPMALAGAVIATAGAILAFTARAAIADNWGTPGTRRTDTQLVTSGPYRLVRHPIYSGVLLLMIGTALGLIAVWWLAAIAAGIYFFYSARTEERFMTERFPDAYPAYRARTKMLLPFIL